MQVDDRPHSSYKLQKLQQGGHVATFSVHFDGDITVDHRVSIRVLGNTYTRMQSAIDRAFLVERYGRVVKYERLSRDEYEETEFIAAYPQEGGIILDALREGAEGIIDKIYSATNYVYGRAVENAFAENINIAQQIDRQKNYVTGVGERTPPYEHYLENRSEEWRDAYSNRSIVKEIDPLVNQISRKGLNNSTVDLLFIGSRTNLPLTFDATLAYKFHKIAADKQLGPPMIVHTWIKSLDIGSKTTKPSAKVYNISSGKEVVLHLFDQAGFNALHPHHGVEAGVRIYACPIMEAGGFDILGGDLMFLKVV